MVDFMRYGLKYRFLCEWRKWKRKKKRDIERDRKIRNIICYLLHIFLVVFISKVNSSKKKKIIPKMKLIEKGKKKITDHL